jgi:hypothetical protein
MVNDKGESQRHVWGHKVNHLATLNIYTFIIIILVGAFTTKLIFLPTNDCKNQVPPVAYIPVQCAQLPTPL